MLFYNCPHQTIVALGHWASTNLGTCSGGEIWMHSVLQITIVLRYFKFASRATCTCIVSIITLFMYM